MKIRKERNHEMKELKDYLDKNNISLLELSRCTNLPYMNLYYSLSNGNRKRELRISELFKICDYLGLSVDELRNKSKHTKCQ